MITNVCLLLEILSIVFCVHCLYGEKFKLDIATTSYLAVHMIILTTINYYDLPKVYTLVTYPVIFVYCGVKFGFRIKEIVINNVLYLAIIGGIQLLVTLLCHFLLKVYVFKEVRLLIVNFVAFLLVMILLPKFRLYRLSIYLQDKERILLIALVFSIAVTVYCVFCYKKIDLIELSQSILLFFSITFICILAMQLSKYRVKSKEIETELKMHQLYAESFHSLTENIRMRQHEFDNHINTIYSQHYIYKTYEKLVNAQKDYCRAVVQDNRFNKLLTSGNPIVIGFLYGKFVEIEKLDIEILYKIGIRELNIGIPIYKLVEILGNLMNNAVEALKASKQYKTLYIAVIEKEGILEIEVRNKSEFIEHSEIETFFKKGVSKKGESRGLGLYNVKGICSEYSLQLYCENKNIDNENWISFVINNKKGII